MPGYTMVAFIALSLSMLLIFVDRAFFRKKPDVNHGLWRAVRALAILSGLITLGMTICALFYQMPGTWYLSEINLFLDVVAPLFILIAASLVAYLFAQHMLAGSKKSR